MTDAGELSATVVKGDVDERKDQLEKGFAVFRRAAFIAVAVPAFSADAIDSDSKAESHGLSYDDIDNILILLDCSHSMKEKDRGPEAKFSVKFEQARTLIAAICTKTSTKLQLGLRTFAGATNCVPDVACRNTELVAAVGSEGRKQILSKMPLLSSEGICTNLVFALQAACFDCESLPGKSMVVLISDGSDTCGGDLNAYARAQSLAVQTTPVIVITWRQSPRTIAQLRLLSEATHGDCFEMSETKLLLDHLHKIPSH